MKIDYIYEAGVFGSYKKANAQSNIDNAKRELARDAQKGIIESKCDELAELYLDMLTEVNSQINAISRKYKYRVNSGRTEESYLLELSNYITKRYYTAFREKEMQINLIKNIYCNRPAIEYMLSQGCFILPLVDIYRTSSFFYDPKEIIPYKNMIKTVANTAEKIIKTHLSKFLSHTVFATILNKVKIITLSDAFWLNTYQSNNMKQFFSYMGITDKGVEFEYPVGQGSSCLDYILDKYTIILCNRLEIDPTKSNEHIWKYMMPESSPWMYNKITFDNIKTNLLAVSADNFYGIKLLKYALDNGIVMTDHGACINIHIYDTLKNMQSVHKLKQEVSNNGLDMYVIYHFNDMDRFPELSVSIGKKITSEKAEQEGVFIDDFEYDIYEFDYNNTTEVESAAKKIVNVCDKLLSDVDKSTKQRIKQIAEDAVKNYLPKLMSKILTSKPHCIGYSNKILLSGDYPKGYVIKNDNNLRALINTTKMQLNKKGNLVFYIDIDFSVPVRGINPKYIKDSSRQTSEIYYEYIHGKHIKIEIPL